MKIISYIVKCDGTFNKKEKAIVKEVFEGLEQFNPMLTDKLIKKIFKSMKLPTLQSFKVNANKLLKDNELKFNLLEFTNNVIATQKSIHQREQEVMDYLNSKAKEYNFSNEMKIDTEQPKLNSSEVSCSHCFSTNTLKKGTRKFKNHTNQRYMCNDCNRIFSERIVETA